MGREGGERAKPGRQVRAQSRLRLALAVARGLEPMLRLLWSVAFVVIAGAARASAPTGDTPGAQEVPMVGIQLSDGNLVARVTDNAPRVITQTDAVMSGYNGLASLQDVRRRKNIFVHAGLNYECGSTEPKMGRHQEAWNAPRLAPMMLARVGERSVKLTQRGAEAAGLDMEAVYTLHDPYVDLTVTFWPDVEIASSSTFWASYLNQVQNTSLFLRGTTGESRERQWFEFASAGHGRTFLRPFDPVGKAWHEYLTDNPVLRQAVEDTPEAIAATVRAGFSEASLTSFDSFWFGFVDDYVFLLILRTDDAVTFSPWISASGGGGVRSPAWDFGTSSGKQAAGERRSFQARLVFKPFQGLDDVLQEVARFQSAPGGRAVLDPR
jgi:hypothetical protein